MAGEVSMRQSRSDWTALFRRHWPVWLVFFILAINAALFTRATASAHISADVFRHMEEIVLPWLQGEADWRVFWHNHHPSPCLLYTSDAADE